MLTESERARYSRHFLLPEFGEGGQERLKRGSVAVVGAGGLGSPALLYLAAAGVGRIGIIEFDQVDASNLQRQVLYTDADLRLPKLDAACARLVAMNPEIAIEPYPTPLTSENALEILGRYDVVIDGTDNFPTRYLVADACTLLDRPNVYGSVFRFEGQVSVFHESRGPCYRCVYPEPPPPAAVPNCAEAGVLGVLPGIVGTIQATEAIKLIAGIGEPLIGRLLLIDALGMSFREMRLRKHCHAHAAVTHLIDYEGFCNPMDINVKELAEKIGNGSDFYLLDVREPGEWSAGHLEQASHIPMRQVPQRIGEIPHDKEIVVYCRSGARSANVQQFLKANGFDNVRNLIGGITAWKREIDPAIRVA